jgi:predicted CXXCH cytochrome family protein
VADSGVDTNHPDLADRIWQNAGEVGIDVNGNDLRNNGIDDDNNGYVDDWQGWNTVDASNDVQDKLGHGTHLAGIIGAAVDNSIGIAGIAPNARLMPIKAIDSTGTGSYSQVAEGIVYATDMGARIINLGFSGTVDSELVQRAVEYAVAHDVLVVAASGNNGYFTPNYPAGYPGVLAVSAVENDGYWAPFSASGDHISLAAPGLDIYSTGTGGSYYTAGGTSQAAAHVSGVAALLAGQPEFASVNDLSAALLQSALDRGEPGRDPYFGYGIVQAFDALNGLGLIKPPPNPGIFMPRLSASTAEELWGRTQVVWSSITNPNNSIDGAFNDLVASSTGAYGASSARSWTFTTVDDTTFNNIAAVYLDFRFYIENWVNDSYNIQVYVPGNPACPLGWCTVMNLRLNPSLPNEALPPTSLTTISIPVTTFLNSAARVNSTQIRLSGSIAVGGVADIVTIHVDEVRLRILDVLPPTPTPSPTPLFIPTATIPANRAATAVPVTDEPHSNFSAITADQCASCHRSHTAQSMSLRDNAKEEQVCFSCHTAGGSGVNVQPAFTTKSNTITRFFSHPISNTTMIHQPDESVGASFGGANRHVECEDCHSPHASSRSATSGSVNAPAAQQEMYQSTGVEPIWTANGAASGFTWLTVADREFQICFKCHSSYSSQPTFIPDGYGWNGSSIFPNYIPNGLGKLTSTNPAQVRDSRDLSREFNSYQVSFHPLAAQGRNINMPSGSFVAPWTQNSIVYCSDCHDNGDGTTNGPHGSPLLHILDGTSEYITQTDPSQSCAPGGCPSIHTSGELCFKCHQFNTYATGSNPVNTTQFRNGVENLHAFHSFGSCYTCHSSHGSGQDHLINFDTTVVSIYPGSNSQTAWQFDRATNTGTCFVACHDGEHGLDAQYRP